LSYLGSVSRGWHDSLSGNYVVKKREISKSKHYFQHPEEFGAEDKTVETKKYGCLLSIALGF
jgi:hypothetical protein